MRITRDSYFYTQIGWLNGGISQVIGLGGNDMSTPVNGIMSKFAISKIDEDKNIESLTILSKFDSQQV